MQLALTAATLFTPLEEVREPLLLIEDGRIAALTSRQHASIPGGARLVEFPGLVLAPGFLDIHVHGGAGHDVMQADAGALAAMARHLARHGVTSYLPTTVTAPLDATLESLDKLGAAVESAAVSPPIEARAQPLGVHLEGPFLSHAKRGVHPPEHLLPPSPELLDRLWQGARHRVSMMTIAPELPGALKTIAHAAGRGVAVSLGHSDSQSGPVEAAIAAGARHATHTFNAMRVLDHREPGILGAALADARLTADIIADGIHVHPQIVELFLRAKGAGGAVLITDAISATGMGDGRYRLGPFDVEVRGDRCLREGRLAGSVLTLDRAVRNVVHLAGWSLQEAIRLATLNPARVIGVEGKKGLLAPGADADIVVLTPAGEVVRTITRGAGV